RGLPGSEAARLRPHRHAPHAEGGDLRHRGQSQSLARDRGRVLDGGEEGGQVLHAAHFRDRRPRALAVPGGVAPGLPREIRSAAGGGLMKKTLSLAAAVWLALGAAVLATDVDGVKVADTVTVDGKTLKLNGAGMRRKMIVRVYVCS